MLLLQFNSSCCQLKSFSTIKIKKGFRLQHTVDKNVFALARLTFYDSVLIGPGKSVRCPHYRFPKAFAKGQRKLSVK